MELSRRDSARMAWRLLLLQVLLNYRTMQGPGYLYALWPWLRDSEHRPTRVRAAAQYLNAHPVMAALALGALRRRVEDGDAEARPEDLTVWANSLCGPLGTVGDALIWDLWKPLVFVAGAILMVWWPAPALWLATAVVGLVVYNAPLAYLRIWGVREGYRLGESVLSALQRPLFAVLRKRLSGAGALLAGLLLAAIAANSARIETGALVSLLIAFVLTSVAIRRGWSLLYVFPIATGLALGLSHLVFGA